MKAQKITLTTDDGQTLTLAITSAVLGQPEEAEEVPIEGAEPVEEPAGDENISPLEKLRRRRMAA